MRFAIATFAIMVRGMILKHFAGTLTDFRSTSVVPRAVAVYAAILSAIFLRKRGITTTY